MKQIAQTLLTAVVATFFLFSCGGDPTASNPDIAKMSDAGKKAMSEASEALCTCLNEHGDGLKEFTKEMKKVLEEIQSGSFAKEFMAQSREGSPFLNQKREEASQHQIESVGKELRSMMPFLSAKDVKKDK